MLVSFRRRLYSVQKATSCSSTPRIEPTDRDLAREFIPPRPNRAGAAYKCFVHLRWSETKNMPNPYCNSSASATKGCDLHSVESKALIFTDCLCLRWEHNDLTRSREAPSTSLWLWPITLDSAVRAPQQATLRLPVSPDEPLQVRLRPSSSRFFPKAPNICRKKSLSKQAAAGIHQKARIVRLEGTRTSRAVELALAWNSRGTNRR